MNPPPPAPAAPKKRGCFFYGCLTLVILAVLAVLLAGVTAWYVSRQLTQLVDRYTATTPLQLPKVTLDTGEYESLEKRVAAFGEALGAGKTPEALALSAREINALFERSPALAEWKGTIHVSLSGEGVRGQVSLPLDALAKGPMLSGLKGRYLNGEGQFEVGLAAGQLVVRLRSLTVNGQALPAELVQALGQQNLADAANRNPELARALNRLEKVAVEGDRLVLGPKKE